MRALTTKPQPARGRQFTLRMGEVRKLVRSADLQDREGRSITIRHLNSAKVDPYEIGLLRLFPEKELVVLSTPSDVPLTLVDGALRVAIPALARVNSAGAWNSDQQLSFLVNLNVAERSIRIVRRLVKLHRRKYGSGSKFSNAFKPRSQSVEETLVEELSAEAE